MKAQPRRKARKGTVRSASRGSTSFPIVGVGASAGGLEAFTGLLKHLPVDTGMAFVLVQHLDPQHESALPQILTRATSMPVHEVTNNLAIKANHVYIIPPNTSLGIARGFLILQPRPQTRAPTRSIDSFFESLAQDQRERAIGVILSGTASDGTLGLEAIKAEGGITFAQDDSARYDSMPRSAISAGCVDFVLRRRTSPGNSPASGSILMSRVRASRGTGEKGRPEWRALKLHWLLEGTERRGPARPRRARKPKGGWRRFQKNPASAAQPLRR